MFHLYNPLVFIDPTGMETRQLGPKFFECDPIVVVADRYYPSPTNILCLISWYFFDNPNIYEALFYKEDGATALAVLPLAFMPSNKSSKGIDLGKKVIQNGLKELIIKSSRLKQIYNFYKDSKFAKALSKTTRNIPLTQAEAEESIEIPKKEGLTVDTKLEHLVGDHFKGGPHIYIDDQYIRVKLDV
jgi:hypothetical protein